MSLNYKRSLTACTAEERFLSKSGVPSFGWKIQLRDFAFRSTAFRGGKLSALAQRHWCETILIDPPYAPIFVIASAPTDTGAMGLLSWIFKHRTSHDKRAFFNRGEPVDFRRNFTTACFHNLLNEATPQRCEEVRNALLAYDEAFRCVAVAGSKNPEAWVLNKLRLRPTAVFYLKDVG